MLKRLILAALVWACISQVAEGRERYWNYCQRGGQKVVTQGLQSSGTFQRTFQSCTIRVYLAGTTTLATIYSDNLTPVSTPLANPFTAASDGYFEFYAAAGRYDIQETFTDTTVSPSVVIQLTWGDNLLCDPIGPNADTDCTVGGPGGLHNLLSATHPDTDPYTPPEIGDLIRGSLSQAWERFAKGTASQLLAMNSGATLPTWQNFNFYQDSVTPVNSVGRLGLNLIEGSNVTITPADDAVNNRVSYTIASSAAGTDETMQKNGVFVGTEPIFNFIEGSNITLTASDEPGATRANLTIAASGNLSLTCDPTSIVDIYVDDAGSDVTGDGSIGNPYATIQHAIDTDVPVFVGAKYYIHISTSGTYAGFTYSGRVDCGGGVTCGNSGPDFLTPFGTGLSILGSTDGVASDSWIINTPIIVDGLKMYLQGVQVDTAGIGLTAKNGSQVALGAVHFYNNNLGLLAATWSQAYLIPGLYVEDDTYTALATADNFDPSSDGFEATEDSVITDSCPDGNNTPLGTTIGCLSNGTGNFGIACLEAKKAQYYLRDDVLIDYTTGVGADGIQALDSHFAMADFTLTSTGLSTAGYGMDLQGSRVSGAAFGGGVYNITSAKYGVVLSSGGEITDIPTIATSVTADYLSNLNSEKGSTNWIGGAGGNTYTYTFSATPTFDVMLGYVHKITLTDNVTSSTISNAFAGASITMQICQDPGGSNTFAWPADVLGADVIGATGSTCNMQRFAYDGVAAKWYATGPMQKNM